MSGQATFQQGRYQVRNELFRDECGVMYLAVDGKMAGREVALRQLNDGVLDATSLQRLAQLNQAALPSVYDLFEEHGQRYLVLEYPRGQTLADVALGPRLREGVVLAWAKQIAEGLRYLHSQGFVHGDIQPQNIVLQDGRRIKLLGGLPAGCPKNAGSRYAAPEIWSGATATPASDIYALGATLHHLLTGTDPNTQPLMAFAPPDVRRPDLSPAVSHAIVKALSQQPQQRFANIEQFVVALSQTSSTHESAGDLPVIGFTPSILPSTPADGPTQRYVPSESSPIPVPPGRGSTAQYDQAMLEQLLIPDRDVGPAPSILPKRPAQQNSRAGLIVLGVFIGLALLAGAWLLFKPKSNVFVNATQVANNGLPTVTRDEGILLSDSAKTATALAAIPPPTQIPTLDVPRATADAIQTFTVATQLAFDDALDARYQRGMAYEETGQYGLALSEYDEILRQDPTYKDTQARRDRIKIFLDATATAGPQQTTIAGGTATAVAQPSPTALPATPTATPIGQIVGDSFDGSTLDPRLWAGETRDGTIQLTNGELQLAATSATCYPVVRTITDTLFPVNNFTLSVTFRYSDVTALGTGFMLADAMATPCGDTDRAGTSWGGIWQDGTQGLIVEFHRDQTADNELKDIRLPYSNGQIDTTEHTLIIQQRNGQQTFILDGNVLFTEQAGAQPQVLWFGNPSRTAIASPWTVLNILSVDLREEP
ncbi:MAG TPA: serine/threonine protein kinase [Herpetosiphon sp.]|uniref:non-specific serine/threonine protein kinase n=1 Tax=Herpetosiphon aurantiacus (strain ATCC 23779 / DSM 785 / 114-95) TaxID=316274 RepID=A9AZW0_HERA2|nr:protein kinase [Herpetosiphon sp.]ABX07164.1 serine/threonine protein kinase with TPR repeats [Herpetosiphon aurantiacus DSM 785]HBW51085.1 serine/threonine protein kinase [Herpetosiphon sp.]